MRITQSKLRQIIKEELENVFAEQETQMTPDAAKNAIGFVLERMPQGAGIRTREPMGFLFSGNASVDSGGRIGFQLADKADYVSPAGGSSTSVRMQSGSPVPTKRIRQTLFTSRGLARDLKEKGLRIASSYDPNAEMRFRFRPAGFSGDQFQGYIIEPL